MSLAGLEQLVPNQVVGVKLFDGNSWRPVTQIWASTSGYAACLPTGEVAAYPGVMGPPGVRGESPPLDEFGFVDDLEVEFRKLELDVRRRDCKHELVRMMQFGRAGPSELCQKCGLEVESC